MSHPTAEQSEPIPRSKKVVRLLIKLSIFGICVLGVIAIMMMPPKEVEIEESVAPPVNVTVERLDADKEIPDTFTLPAVIEPNRSTTLASEIAGRIQAIHCTKGQFVHAGDILCQLNDDLLVPQKLTAEAQLKRDRLELERMKDLVQKQATAQRDLDDAATRVAISQATLAQISATLDRCQITSPSDGYINDLTIELGEYLDPGVPVAQLVDTNTVKVIIQLPEKDVPFFKLGQTVEIIATLKNAEQEIYTGRITFISETADPQTRATRVEVSLSNSENTFHSGQIVLTRLTRQTFHNAIFIPLLAVIPMESSKAVYIVEDNKAVRKEVQLGAIKGDRVQIVHGLHAGDELIVEGHRFVAPGQSVAIIQEKP